MMSEDIEVHITCEFDSPRDVDWEEMNKWTTDDYRDYGCTEDIYFAVFKETTVGKVKHRTGEKRVGLQQSFECNVLIYETSASKKLSIEFSRDSGRLTYITRWLGNKSEYNHNFHDNGTTNSIKYCNSRSGIRYEKDYDYNGELMKKMTYNSDGTVKKNIYKRKYAFLEMDSDDEM